MTRGQANIQMEPTRLRLCDHGVAARGSFEPLACEEQRHVTQLAKSGAIRIL
jgi:hypothetical protein